MPREDNTSSQASDLLPVNRVDVSQDGIFAWGDLLGQVDFLGELHVALLQGTLEIDFVGVVAQLNFLVEDADETVFDLEVDLGAFFNVAGEVAGALDGEWCATKHDG